MVSQVQILGTLGLAWLSVFLAAALPWPKPWVGTQPDLLPALMVYAALRTSLLNVFLLALWGGLMLDTVSANPPGTSCLPLMCAGLILHFRRELLLRDEPFAQFMLGLLAGALVPGLTILLLLTLGREPLLGWGTLVPWAVLAVSSAVCTPLLFRLFAGAERWLGHRPAGPTAFRPDREIRRGRY
ncbi:hypothetical protein G4L39_02675 [Limisphaera ngatamarikiensis]|jgi:rod shape-determining protein MreD|uniref:Rod shape-determining protein MreD n=1 Tax=Limisphaera ngatamarikiensis TaxID=1324935 RepID=A0A6M1RSJ1_9BACT|nr:hypothetical protein [Limisphaera ngatamarikiensis]